MWDAAPWLSHGRSAGVKESQVSHVFPNVSFMNCSVLYTGKVGLKKKTSVVVSTEWFIWYSPAVKRFEPLWKLNLERLLGEVLTWAGVHAVPSLLSWLMLIDRNKGSLRKEGNINGEIVLFSLKGA